MSAYYLLPAIWCFVSVAKQQISEILDVLRDLVSWYFVTVLMLSPVTRRQMIDFIARTPIFNWAICVIIHSLYDALFIQFEKYLTNWPATLRTVLSGMSRLSTETGWHFCHLSRAKMSHSAMVTSYMTCLIHCHWPQIPFLSKSPELLLGPLLTLTDAPLLSASWSAGVRRGGGDQTWPGPDSGSGYRLLTARCHNYTFQNNEKRLLSALIDISEVFAKSEKTLASLN